MYLSNKTVTKNTWKAFMSDSVVPEVLSVNDWDVKTMVNVKRNLTSYFFM